ncbi:MAG: hypothetical protein B5766_11065 [Candidatus Lumbricidophila eiseniae]|uniref:peptidylprolyl isomerase n=1 Tax=Candidatus Lumbricidiphila eiseniae TaxID=1969409 RepID=A0A2A6FPC7_9MICO|nr:MAG: hypothetical protein B5766_11065 [Candidatus Lumbricidophila eiseniae]
MNQNPPRAVGVTLCAIAVGALVTLSGCSGANGNQDYQSSGAGCMKVSSGDVSRAVKVTGDIGSPVTATFKTPAAAKTLQRSLAKKGSGSEDIPVGTTVSVTITLYNGTTGKQLNESKGEIKTGDQQVFEALRAAVDCVPAGSRTVVVAPPASLFGSAGNSELGVSATDTVVMITDLQAASPPLVPGAWTSDVPTVTWDASGKPSVTLPGPTPPKDLVLNVLQKGTGATVKDGDSVTLDYQGTSWEDGKLFDESYGKQPATFATGSVVKGFGAALIGQTVGTKLIVSIPPQYGYGTDPNSPSSNGLGGKTLVFVVDIKDTGSAQ